jgi:phosphate transport system substrate-binding protein
MGRYRRGAAGSALLATLGVAAAACGSSTPTASTSTTAQSSTSATAAVACGSGTITGAGSTFVATILQQWTKDYEAKCPGATINYQAVGSGAGVTQFTSGTVDFGASDVVLSAAQSQALAAKGTVLQIPWAAGGVAIEFHVSGVSSLKLDAATIAGIFAGKIVKWNDPAIKALNSGVTLPSEAIQTFHRSDASGTSGIFTGYLAAAAPSVWTYGANKTWPAPGGQGAKGSDGVTAAVGQTEGGIGYAEVSYAKGANLPMAAVKNGAGSFVQPTGNAVTAALAEADVPADLTVKPNYTPTGASAYPIASTTWVVVAQKQTDAAKATLLKDFITYAVTAGQASANSLYYAPLPSSLADQDKAAATRIGI